MTDELAGLVIASTVAAHKCDGREELRWLERADVWLDEGARIFLAWQGGHGHDERFAVLLERLADINAAHPGRVVTWHYSIDQGETEVTSRNRLIGICTGRNMAHEYAQRDESVEAILFLDTDVMCPEDLPWRLLEIDRAMVGACVPSYCLDGPKVHPSLDVREHWNTAGCLLVRRPVFRQVAWRWDSEGGLTDDPAFQLAAAEQFGMTWVRHDVFVGHDALTALENRGTDRTVIR